MQKEKTKPSAGIPVKPFSPCVPQEANLFLTVCINSIKSIYYERKH